MDDRQAWIAERLTIAECRYDELFAPIYDARWGSDIDPTHASIVGDLIRRLPARSVVLDAACGTGKYWPLFLEAGVRIVGVDQSLGMLSAARVKHPMVETYQARLHQFRLKERFDGIICIDALENIFPEHWPLVLRNLAAMLKSGGLMYITIELAGPSGYTPEGLRQMVESHREVMPLRYGEVIEDGGYHYFPEESQVDDWLIEAGFGIVGDREGDGYRHLVVDLRHTA